MTLSFPSQTLTYSPGTAVGRTSLAPFGWYTRHMILSYSRYTFLATCAVLVLALSIDLTLFLAKVVATVSASPGFLPLSLAWYILLRATDFLAELLPLACFIGVFCAEIVHTISQERLLVWLSGRRPRQCLVPVLIFGAIVGLIQGALNIYLRPLAVMTMAVENLGSYGERFGPRPQPTPQWIPTGRNLIQASVDPGPPLTLRNVRIYRLDDSFALESIYRAKVAEPLDDHSWTLIDGYRWDSAVAATGTNVTPGQESRSGFGQSVAFSQTTIDLAAPPIWISNLRIGSRYLESDTFSGLAKVQFSPDTDFRTWANARYSLSLFCAAMPFLAACLSTVLLANKVSLARLCFIAAAGYSANIAMKTFILLGEHGRLSPSFAGWTVPIVVLLICTLAVRAEGKMEAIRSRLSKFLG